MGNNESTCCQRPDGNGYYVDYNSNTPEVYSHQRPTRSKSNNKPTGKELLLDSESDNHIVKIY